MIRARSNNKWYNGFIVNIEINIIDDLNNEWLIVKYNKNKKTKKIQRYCNDIKPIPNNNILSLDINSKCLIYSDIDNKWLNGEVISIHKEDDGEWLTIKFVENNKNKICEIQRYSEEIKVFKNNKNNIINKKEKEEV